MKLKPNTRLVLLTALLFMTSLMMGGSSLGGGGCFGQLESFSVGGSLSGVSATLILQNNAGDDLSLNSDGEFTFATFLAEGSAYSVTVLTQPEGQICTVTHGTGIITSVNITNIEVTCASESESFTLGGSVSGLSGGTVILQNSDSQQVSVSSDGSFQFATPLAEGSSYQVTVLTQPTGQFCTLSNGSASNISADVTNISVTCEPLAYSVGGNVTGLTLLSGAVTLENDSVDTVDVSSDGPYSFNLDYGSDYSIGILTQPTGQNCEITFCPGSLASGICSGTVTSDIGDMDVVCTNNDYNVGGSLTGLADGLIVTVENNGASAMPLVSNGPYAYSLEFGTSYSIEIVSPQPSGQECVISGCAGGTLVGGVCSGTVSAEVTDIDITCAYIIAYVSSTDDNSVYYCTINSNGTFNVCTSTPPGAQTWEPFESSFATLAGTQHAYVADNGGSDVRYCNVAAGGALSSCADASGSMIVGAAVGVTLATIDETPYAYVSTNVVGTVYVCDLNVDGSFNSCTITPASQSWFPFAVAFATVSDTQYAYVADGINGRVDQCVVSLVDGTLSACQNTLASPPSWTPNGLTFATMDSTQYAYIAGSGDGLFRCTLNSDGTFNACANTPTSGAPSWNPRGISVATVNGVQYAYVANIAGSMYVCSIASDGNLTACVPTPDSGAPAWSPRGITLQLME